MTKTKIVTANGTNEWAIVEINGEQTDYLISKTGVLFSLEKGKVCKLSTKWTNHKNQEKRYKVCDIKLKNGSYKQVMIHRLVAEAFIYKKDERYVVDHLDENTLNNNVENLNWVTIGENVAKSLSMAIDVWEWNEGKGNYVGRFSSITNAIKTLDLNPAGVNKVLKKQRKQTKGYTMEYVKGTKY